MVACVQQIHCKVKFQILGRTLLVVKPAGRLNMVSDWFQKGFKLVFENFSWRTPASERCSCQKKKKDQRTSWCVSLPPSLPSSLSLSRETISLVSFLSLHLHLFLLTHYLCFLSSLFHFISSLHFIFLCCLLMCCVLGRLNLVSFFACWLLCLSGGSRVVLYSAPRDQSTQHTRVSVAKCLSMAVFCCVVLFSFVFYTCCTSLLFFSRKHSFLDETSAEHQFAPEPQLHLYPLLVAVPPSSTPSC